MATTGAAQAAGSDHHPEIDWVAAARSPEFRELVKKKRSFVVPGTIFFLAWYFGFVILAGYAPDFMGREFLTDGFTVGYALALSQFVMTWGLGAWYLRKSDREFDPLAKRAADVALRAGREQGRPPMTPIAAVNGTALAVFGVIVAVTLVISYFASRRVNSATDFWAAGRGLTGPQNGFAIAGDYMSAASFLGIAGLIYLFGFDGFLYSVGFLVAFLTVLFLLAERMRNAGKYTIADVLSYRLNQQPARAAAALGTLTVVAFYLIAQMVGAGVLIEGLVEIDFSLAVILTGVFMVSYIVLGGMLATSWVQIIKAGMLMSAAVVMTIWVLAKVSWNPIDLFRDARSESADGEAYLQPGLFLSSPLDTVSLGLGLVLGTAGLPHILMRFFTVPNAKAARSSVMWAMVLIGAFYVMTTALGFGARAILGQGGEEAAGATGNGALPLLADELGGEFFQAIIAGVAFATILAVVAGLVISASGRRCPRRLVEHRAQRTRLREGGGLGGQDRRDRDRCDRDRHRDPRWRGPERIVHGRPRVRGRCQRQLPCAAAGAHLAPLQHDRRGHRSAGRRDQLRRARDHQPDRVARAGLRGRPALGVRLGQPGDHQHPARVHRLLARHGVVARAGRGNQLRRAVGAL